MKLLERLFEIVDAVNAGELPRPAPAPRCSVTEHCAPGVDAAAAGRLRHWLDAAETRGPQPAAPFNVITSRDDAGCRVISPEPRLKAQ